MRILFTRSILLTLAVFICFPVHSQVFIEADVKQVVSGFSFLEGPVWLDDEGLLFSDIPANKVFLWKEIAGATEYINPSGNSNGLGIYEDGTLILCQHGARQLGMLDEQMNIIPLAMHYGTERLSSPNDLAFHSDGAIFFTDPPYGLNNSGDTETGFNGIYRLSTESVVQLLDSTLYRPNGIAFSPDELILYVSDTESRKIFAWDVVDDSTVINKREFAHLNAAGSGADGMKVDADGYIYATGPGGLWVIAPDGTIQNTISVPGQSTNCAWGDADRKALYVTTGNAIYKLTKKEEVSSVVDYEGGVESYLLMNYPNPFSASTTIPFKLGEQTKVVLSVHDVMGKTVATLVDSEMKPGSYSVLWETADNTNGNYIIVLETNGHRQVSSCEVLNKTY